MKVSPLRAGAPSLDAPTGQSASADKIARAKAIVSGQTPPEPRAERQETTTEKLRRIRMNTNATPGPREYAQPAEIARAAQTEALPGATVTTDNPDTGEPALATSEDNKPLSPQFAALAKQKRAAQLKEAELTAREERLKTTEATPRMSADEIKERIKADALGFVLENGATWEQLTAEVTRSTEGGGPALTKVETDLRKEIKRLETVIEAQGKTVNEKWDTARTQELASIQKEADAIIAADDAYQMIRDTKSNADVSRLIKRVLDEEGVFLDAKEALDLLENDLLQEGLKYGRISKVQKAAQPAPAPQAATSASSQDGIRRQVMRTLTNRDNASTPMNRRDRMLAAALGKKL